MSNSSFLIKYSRRSSGPSNISNLTLYSAMIFREDEPHRVCRILERQPCFGNARTNSQQRIPGLHRAQHPLPTRNERGEDRGEGKPIRTRLLSPAPPQPSPPSDGREGEITELDA